MDTIPISIHSTTRVETWQSLSRWESQTFFNPLHHEGGDLLKQLEEFPMGNFNPLHHEGGDSPQDVRPALPIYFNPLHHEGGDREDYNVLLDWCISIHSTTRVETVAPLQSLLPFAISIHSTTRVETLSIPAAYSTFPFQSTPPRGWRHYHGYRHLF